MRYGSHPLNLALRFFLELTAWFGPAWWAWHRFGWWAGIILGVALMAIWVVFAVRGDESRSGKTVVQTPGRIRLILEVCMFLFGVWTVRASGYPDLAWILLAVVILHHLFSADRLEWLWFWQP